MRKGDCDSPDSSHMQVSRQVHTEMDMRRFVFPGRTHQWVFPRVHLQGRLGNGAAWGVGGAYFLQALPQTPDQEAEQIRREIRPHQE